jgi:hypothetical protein
MTQATLPRFFRYEAPDDLVRLGRANDGGYLVSATDINRTDFLIGLGVSDDWSFESDFTKLHPVKAITYDGSLGPIFWMKRLVLMSVSKPWRFYGFQKLFQYLSFYILGPGQLRDIYVGLDAKSSKHLTLQEILSDIDKENIFLKIDIEGSEYRLLDDLIANENKISGLVIEFHDVDLHLGRISEFIGNFKKNIVHNPRK